jgi:hypothetical protein
VRAMPTHPSPHLPRDDVFQTLRGLARADPVTVRVRGGCMEPVLGEGEEVRVIAARLYWPGDVVVFRAGDGRLLAHRLLGYRLYQGHLALVTRGDSCAVHDSPVPPGEVLGRVPAARPGLVLRLRSLLGFLGLALSRLRR